MFPVLLDTPFGSLQSYGVFLALAYLVAIELGVRKIEKMGYDPKKISNFVLILVLSAFAGGRILYAILEWETKFAAHPWKVFYLWEGGLVFYGGLIAAFIACLSYTIYTKMNVWEIADAAMPSVMVGQAIGRLGCLAVGCCWGAPYSGPLSISLHGELRHPVQAYASVSLFFGWLILEWCFRTKRKRFPGICLVGYMAYQSWHRYLMETFRVDPRGGQFHFGMSISQEIAVGLGLGAILLAAGLQYFYWRKLR